MSLLIIGQLFISIARDSVCRLPKARCLTSLNYSDIAKRRLSRLRRSEAESRAALDKRFLSNYFHYDIILPSDNAGKRIKLVL